MALPEATLTKSNNESTINCVAADHIGLALPALSFLMLAPLFIWFAPDMTRKELTDFVGEKVA
jgi:hypothetical protein